MATPTQEQTHDHAIGSGALEHPWWGPLYGNDAAENATRPDDYIGWGYTVDFIDPELRKPHGTVTINHNTFLGALRTVVANPEFRYGDTKHSYKKDFLDNVNKLLRGNPDADLDADGVDIVLQVLAVTQLELAYTGDSPHPIYG